MTSEQLSTQRLAICFILVVIIGLWYTISSTESYKAIKHQIFQMNVETPKKGFRDDTPEKIKPSINQENLPECGEVCFYKGIPINGTRNDFPLLTKHINCENIMKRMAWDKYKIIYPPPKNPPTELLEEFTQYGMMPLSRHKYYSNFNPKKTSYKVFSKQSIEGLRSKDKAGFKIKTYKGGLVLRNVIQKYSHYVNKSTGFVIGTLSPWLEAILLNNGAKHVTTLEYGNLDIQHPQITTYHPDAYAKKYLRQECNQFDFGASFSSIEHSGLGRYGDPLNPYGDLEAMAQAWCMTKPGGVFFLGLPSTKKMHHPYSKLEWNGMRIYGPSRLSQVTANWDLVDLRYCDDIHAVLVLKKLPDIFK